eukprot:2210126-Pleurochrysis_carterae.AAC.2
MRQKALGRNSYAAATLSLPPPRFLCSTPPHIPCKSLPPDTFGTPAESCHNPCESNIKPASICCNALARSIAFCPAPSHLPCTHPFQLLHPASSLPLSR